MLKTNLFLQKNAKAKGYAVPAFNINNLEITKAVINTASKMKSPVILQTSEGAIKYAGMKNLISLAKNAEDENRIPLSLHLDHGQDFDVIRKCIKLGYSSVMFDGSHMEFKDNVKNTKKVVNLAHKKGISVEGELGVLAGIEENIKSKNHIYTDPDQAKEFTLKTGVDTLAIAIGTSHGAYKFSGESKLDIKRLKEIEKKVKTPLVLHGASGVPEELKKKLLGTGLNIGKAKGVSDQEIRKAVKAGITKVNIDTDLRLAFTYGLRNFIKKNNEDFDPRKIMKPAMDEIEKVVEAKIKVLGSNRRY
ncbi:fructose-1,6-bisphosphate aldolase, class II [Candidatus Woesearchaeota archaeon]|nr:MAG: fructose-1,6-bisphosphate aldolase, class II [Candidatus Woesearchaeota archaeon]